MVNFYNQFFLFKNTTNMVIFYNQNQNKTKTVMENVIITLIIVGGICQIVKYVMVYLTYRITVNANETNPVVNYVKNGEEQSHG